jgi:hypothetical protein
LDEDSSILFNSLHIHLEGKIVHFPIPPDLLAASNLPLPLVNQNLAVMVGSTKASNTSATGLRMSISALAIGECFIPMTSIQ